MFSTEIDNFDKFWTFFCHFPYDIVRHYFLYVIGECKASFLLFCYFSSQYGGISKILVTPVLEIFFLLLRTTYFRFDMKFYERIRLVSMLNNFISSQLLLPVMDWFAHSYIRYFGEKIGNEKKVPIFWQYLRFS